MINAQQNAVQNINKLSFKLLQEIHKAEGNKNILISAYSISNAMAMTWLGTKGESKEELQKTLFPYSEKDVAQDIYRLNEALSFNRNIELYTANNMWLSKNYEAKKRFEKSLQEYFSAKIHYADFQTKEGVEKARLDVNQFVEKATKENIKDFIAEGVLDESTVMVLVNAVYYYAKWKTAFDEKNTFDDVFKTIDQTEKNIAFMHTVLTSGYYKNNELTAIELAYENSEASFIIILPDDFQEFTRKLNQKYFNVITTGFKNKSLNISIPKFKEEGDYELIEYFKNMGINKLFGSQADLSGISGNKDIKISHIIHKAIIDVNESGTEASAATAVIGSRSVSSANETIRFKADRPFFYFIKEKSTGTVLFSGCFVKP